MAARATLPSGGVAIIINESEYETLTTHSEPTRIPKSMRQIAMTERRLKVLAGTHLSKPVR
uniref:hypothetical protein n=1 Tax=Cryobacterium sp. TaxID=1926290 RepID=UPI0015EF563F|nr:hypothetical protein [Cryobacterium sp.]